MSDETEPIDLLARQLGTLDVDPERAEIIRARMHDALDRQIARSRPGWRRTLRRAYRQVELGAVGALAVSYFVWVVQIVLR